MQVPLPCGSGVLCRVIARSTAGGTCAWRSMLSRPAAAEIENHTGLAEKSLAEFIFSLSKGSRSVKDFQKQLLENGAEFQDSLVHTLWNIIQHLQVRGRAPLPVISYCPCLAAETGTHSSEAFLGLCLVMGQQRMICCSGRRSRVPAGQPAEACSCACTWICSLF